MRCRVATRPSGIRRRGSGSGSTGRTTRCRLTDRAAREKTRVDCYATSTDLVHWERPSLGLYEWNRSKDNNICHDPEGRSLYHIYRDEDEPDPGQRYKGMFGFTERSLGVSTNGFDWTMLDLPAIPSHDESHFFFDEIDRRYTLMPQATDGVGTLGVAFAER